jgi:hypothetical protein
VIAALATSYLAAGALLALIVSRREDTHEWSWRVWAYVVTAWPALLAVSFAKWSWPRLAALEVRMLTWVVGVATRRLARRGCTFCIERTAD